MALLVRWINPVAAADVTLKVVEKEPPKEIGESIRKVLETKAIQLLQGDKPIYELWFRKDVPLKSKPETPAKGLQSLDEVTLLGVAVVAVPRRDYKDNEILPGPYTIRFSLQPQDGDHLGTSEFPFFAVLIPAKSDSALDAIKTYKAMVKASGKGTATGHPVVLSLRPPSSESGDTPNLTTPAPDHKAVRLKLPAKAPDSDQPSSIIFELVHEGKYKT
jgi:hypothetical protein